MKTRASLIRTSRVPTPLRSLLPMRLGPLTMRNLPIPDNSFGVSLLHEILLPASETPSIYHKFTEEVVFVIAGRAIVYLDNQPISVKTGDTLRIPARVAHRLVTGKSGVQALSLFSPALDMKRPDVCVEDDAAPRQRAKKYRGSKKRGEYEDK